jgi:hypothetical protein
VSDTARNFLIGCAETVATAWTKKDLGIWDGFNAAGAISEAERQARS